ncbi:metallophosphoesterase family protein [Granulicella arctica]|uniref:metallophosphoesterase family protein n=1 Tax=Granulicella arctica TaxID=940613 RepID=UPI0021E048A8|nr:metallophosphoesterase [Granulicella arctica]
MNDALDASKGESLTVAQRDALIVRLQAAWNNLPADKQAALKPMLDNAHVQLSELVATGKPPAHNTQQTLRMKSYLTGDWDGHLAAIQQPINQAVAQPLAAPAVAIAAPALAAAIEVCVGPDGEILGTGKYQQLDPRWELVAGTVWLENLLHKHPFPAGTPEILPMDDDVSFALLSDFGTGNFGAGDSPSTKISKFVPTLNPDYTIHLGDTYYAGTSGEEVSNLINFWPTGSKGSFTMNSNHEMYSGGGPYFNEAVGGPTFNKLQSPYSFFALENTHWIIVGLDSAYYSDVLTLYMNGTLGTGNAQIAFLQEIAKKGKKVIVMTHHNGLPESGIPGAAPLQLFTEVMGAFAGQAPPAYWYWGHAHAGVAYTALAEQNGMLCRCIGHAALPWGLSSDLQAGQAQGKVEWFEQCNAGDPDNNLRVFNGFLGLQLNGPDLVETFYDETGRVAWRPGTVDKRCS